MPATAGAGRKKLLACVALCCFTSAHAEVIYHGLSAELEANVRAFSRLESTPCDSSTWRVERLFRTANGDIRSAMQALGYYEPTISGSLEWGEECWTATFEIDAGEPVLLRDVDIRIEGEAVDNEIFQSRIATDRPQPGEVLNHGTYTNFKRSLSAAAAYAGFFEAEFAVQQVVVDLDARTADMTLHLDSGPKYVFGDIEFTQGIITSSLLRRFTDIRPGDPYSRQAINDLHAALRGSGYFGSVMIRTDQVDEESKVVPVFVNLTPSKRHVFSGGGGFATDTGVQARLNYLNRRVNQRGHQFESRFYVSRVRTELDAAYRWPRRDPRSEWYGVNGGIRHEETDTSRQDTYKIGLLRTRKPGDAWLETMYLDFEYEDYKIGDDISNSRLFIFGMNWGKVVGRALGRSEGGYRLNFDVRTASDQLGSDTSFLQARTELNWITPLGEKTRLLMRSRLGATAKDDLDELPASVRFFTGGDHTVRGYAYESLGPVNDDGVVVGGSYLATFGVETDWAIKPKWGLAAFVDTGSAFNKGDPEFSTGAGIGVRWYSPIGPVRFDIAHPFDDPDNDVRFHLILGPDL